MIAARFEPGNHGMATDGAIEVARGLQLQGRMIEAEALYRDLLGKQPDALKALEGLGVVLFQQGRAEEAAALFARGVAIEPQSVRFHANLGEALRTIRRFEQALDHLRKAVALGPTDVQAWNSLGLVAFDLQRYAAALHSYGEAIRLKPRFVHAHVWRPWDLVIWDNRTTMHRARRYDDLHDVRDMHRTTVRGDGPTAPQLQAA